MIDNTYLFKVEVIIFKYESDQEKIIERILKLSTNNLNTVKIVKLRRNINIDYLKVISDLLNSNKNYNFKNIPKIFLEGEGEIIINDNCNDSSKAVYINKNCSNNNGVAILSINENSIHEDIFYEFLMFLHYNLRDLSGITIKYPKKVDRNITLAITHQMKELYKKFKHTILNHLYERKIYSFSLFFINEFPESDNILFTILEIMSDMKIRINNLYLNCTFTALADFMGKYNESERLSTNTIYIKNDLLDRKSIEELHQFSDIIEGKIIIDFTNAEIKMRNNNIQKDLINIFNSKERSNSNFLHYENCDIPILNKQIRFRTLNEALIFSDKFKKSKYLIKKNNAFCYKNISLFEINLEKKVEQINLYYIFSMIKEHQFVINCAIFNENKHFKAQYASNVISFFIESVLDTQYRKKEIEYFPSIVDCSKLLKKKKRYKGYLAIHGILKE